MKFDVGDVVQCLWGSGTLKYEAKVVKADPSKPKTPYLVHYQGWNDRWDEWVPEKRLIGTPSAKKSHSSAASTSSSGKSSSVVTNSKKPPPPTPPSAPKRAPSPARSSRSTKSGGTRQSRPSAPQDISLATPTEEEAATSTASSFEPIEPPPAAPPSKSRSPPKRVPPPQKSGQGTVKVPPAEDIAADVREIQKAVSPPTASVVKSKPPPKPSRKTTKAPTVDSHFAEEISADMFHQLNRPNEEEPDFSQFQEPEDADAPTSSKPRARRQSRLSEGEPDAKRRRTGQETVKAETIDKKAPARRTKKTPTEDQQAAMYLSVANAALANEMDEGTEFIEIQEPLEPQPVAPSLTMSGTAPVVAAAKRPTVKPKAPVVRKQQPELKRPLPPPQQTLVMTPAEYEQHVAGVHEDEEPQHFEPMIAAHGHPHGHPHAHHQHQHQHHHGATEFVDQDDGVTPAGRYASLQGITVTGSAPAPEAPSRVIMKLKAPPDSRTAAARAAAQKFKTPLRVGPDGMEYIDQYYSPQLHVGGRGRFGVIGQGPPPAQPIPDKPEDFSYLPPEIVSDHCYGKTPPTAGSSQAAQQVFHGGDIGQYGRGRLVPAHLLPTANLSYHQQAAIYRPSRVGGVTYQTTSRLRVAQQRSPSPLGYRGAGESAFALSDEGLVEGYVDANGMEVVGFDGGQMTGVTVSMMGGGSLIGVDRMPANILDDGDELAETSIDIQ